MSKNNEVAQIINIAPFNRHSWGQTALAELTQNSDIEIPDAESELNSLVLGVFSDFLFHCLSQEEQIKFINNKSKEAIRFKKYFAGHFSQVGEALCAEFLDGTLDVHSASFRKNK